jgi:hypothetical protein
LAAPKYRHDPVAVVDMWAANLSGAAPKILRLLFERGEMSRDEVAAALGMQPRGGHWNSAWKELKDNNIVTVENGTAVLTEMFV